MDDKDKIIGLLRKQLQDAHRKISAMEQEIALLNYEKERSGRVKKQARI